MQHIEAEACHKRAWACLRAAGHESHKGRRAILVSAAYTWKTLAREIDEAADRKAERMVLAPKRAAQARAKAAVGYVPAPAGITFWGKVAEVRRDGQEREVPAPETKPLAARGPMLDDEDILALLRRLGRMARDRGFLEAAHEALDEGAPDGMMKVLRDDEPSRKPVSSDGFPATLHAYLKAGA